MIQCELKAQLRTRADTFPAKRELSVLALLVRVDLSDKYDIGV